MSMKTILVPTEQHELMGSTLQTALLLARKFDSYMEGFAMFPAMVELFALDTGGPLPIEVKENDAEMAKQARGLFEKFMSDHGVARSSNDGRLALVRLAGCSPGRGGIRRQLRPGLRRHRAGPARRRQGKAEHDGDRGRPCSRPAGRSWWRRRRRRSGSAKIS